MLPARNRKDFEDIPEEVRQQLTFTWLERVDDAVSSALEPAKVAEGSSADRETVSPL
jgi:ATP-dependent Lon protease